MQLTIRLSESLNKYISEAISNPDGVHPFDDFVAELADDIQADIIKQYLSGEKGRALAAQMRASGVRMALQVDDVRVSDFGVNLHNLYVLMNFPGKLRLRDSAARQRVIQAMITAMLVTQADECDRELNTVVSFFSKN